MKVKRKALLILGIILALATATTVYAVYSYFFSAGVVLRQYVSPAVYTLDMGVLYTSITYQDEYDSGWITPQSWKTWQATYWEVNFLNKEILDKYFREFKVRIQFNSLEHGTLQDFTLGFNETWKQLEYSFEVLEPDYGNITLRITAEPLSDLGLSFGEHEIELKEIPLIEWCP